MNDKNRLIRVLGLLALVGRITAVPLIIAFAQNGWGAPGTAVYKRYELLNRLMAVSLLLMSAGWLGMVWRLPKGYGRGASVLALIGSLIMVAGTAAEFWLFSDLPYSRGTNLRNVAFAAFGMGGLVLDVGATILGVAIWRTRSWPRWSALVLMMALPIDFAAFFLLGSPFLGATVLAFVIGFLLRLVGNVPDEIGTAVP